MRWVGGNLTKGSIEACPELPHLLKLHVRAQCRHISVQNGRQATPKAGRRCCMEAGRVHAIGFSNQSCSGRQILRFGMCILQASAGSSL